MAEWKDKVDMLSGAILEPAVAALSLEETKTAAAALVKPTWKSVVRVKQDKVPAGQEFGLISFTPAHGARPNKYGVYGTAKLRGNFTSEESAAEEAERIIRHIDSINEIYTVRVGQEFPLTKEVKFTENFDTVDLSKSVDEIARQREKEEKEKAAKEKKVIVDRERQLLAEHKQILDGTYEQDPLDVYTQEQIKRAQLLWTLENTKKRIESEIEPAIERARATIADMDKKDPTLRTKYFDKYREARESVGIPTELDKETGTQTDFIKYLPTE